MGRPRTGKHLQVFHYIGAYITENGYPPTVREIANGLHMSSTSVVAHYLKVLEEEEYIMWEYGKARTIRLLKPL